MPRRCPLNSRCPLFRASVKGGSTVYIYMTKIFPRCMVSVGLAKARPKYSENSDNSTDKGGSLRSPIRRILHSSTISVGLAQARTYNIYCTYANSLVLHA